VDPPFAVKGTIMAPNEPPKREMRYRVRSWRIGRQALWLCDISRRPLVIHAG